MSSGKRDSEPGSDLIITPVLSRIKLSAFMKLTEAQFPEDSCLFIVFLLTADKSREAGHSPRAGAPFLERGAHVFILGPKFVEESVQSALAHHTW